MNKLLVLGLVAAVVLFGGVAIGAARACLKLYDEPLRRWLAGKLQSPA